MAYFAAILLNTARYLPHPAQPTAAAVLPLREENQMKSYLLLPAQRRPLLQQLGGRVEEAPQGALSLEPLLQVRRLMRMQLGGGQPAQRPLASVACWPCCLLAVVGCAVHW